MVTNEVEKKLSSYLALGSLVVTIFLLSNTNSDPVNVTKLFALGGVAVSTFLIAAVFGHSSLIAHFKLPLVLVAVFDLVMVFSSILSLAPFSQNFFGAFGRNNGLLTYSFFSLIMISALLIAKVESFTKMIYGLFAAGFINIIYCAWALSFGDPIPWNNPYGNILGLFGNPDFISAFLGMLIAGSLAFIVSSQTSVYLRITLGLGSLLAFFEIVKSHAIQGLVVTAGGFAIVGFYVVRDKFKNQIFALGYGALVAIFGVVAIFGTLQKGPLNFVYKRSVSMRGSYWNAGIEMGKTHPFTGVGLDTYGDWYRRARPPVALIDTPGINTLSNVAHNVVIDFFASGGFPLLISYLALLSLGLIAIVKITLRKREYDREFVALTAAWLCYEVQSFISINQIGLAIWGWLFLGLLIAYEFSTRSVSESTPSIKRKTSKSQVKRQTNIFSPQLVAGIGLVAGLIIALPPLSADSKWFSATRSHNAAKVEAALVPGYFNPADSYRYAQAVNLFQSSNLPELAHKYALIAVKFNPDYSDAWHQLYLLPNATSAEKDKALANMKRLDPKNPDVTAAP